MLDETEYLTAKQVAPILGVSLPWLGKKRKEGKGGPAWQRRGGKVLYLREDILRYIHENRQGV